MYTEVDGKRSPMNLNFGFDGVEEHYDAQPHVGSNKGLLLFALIISIIAVIVSGYYLYASIKTDGKKTKENFGYRLY